ncbi:MAG: hypothetical protein ACI9X0_002214 [Kiritimatiellia bacterium]|jgi:hypothetical protein
MVAGRGEVNNAYAILEPHEGDALQLKGFGTQTSRTMPAKR